MGAERKVARDAVGSPRGRLQASDGHGTQRRCSGGGRCGIGHVGNGDVWGGSVFKNSTVSQN
jgi:hypothetical protein